MKQFWDNYFKFKVLIINYLRLEFVYCLKSQNNE